MKVSEGSRDHGEYYALAADDAPGEAQRRGSTNKTRDQGQSEVRAVRGHGTFEWNGSALRISPVVWASLSLAPTARLRVRSKNIAEGPK